MLRSTVYHAFLLLLSAALIADTPETARFTGDPPETIRRAARERVNGVDFVDHYRWLEALEAESDEVKGWTTKQNNHTRAVLDSISGRPALERRFAELMSVGSIGLPEARRNRYFYTERQGTEDQPKLYLREGFSDKNPRLLLDPTALDVAVEGDAVEDGAGDGAGTDGKSDVTGLYSLDWFVPSHDGSLLAFGLSHAGDEMSVLHVMNVDSSEWLADEIPGKARFSGWLPDSSGFFYSVLERPEDPYSRAVRFHRVGRHPRQDRTLLKQTAPSEIPSAFLSHDGRWLVVGIFRGWSEQDLYVVDADRWFRTGEFQMRAIAENLAARFVGEAVLGDTLYMLTTLDATNGQLYAVDLNRPDRSAWRLVIRERSDAVLDGVHLARGMLVGSYKKEAISRLERFHLDGTPFGALELPGIGAARIKTNRDRTEAYVSFTSYNEPRTIYRVDLVNGDQSMWARPQVPVDPATVSVEQVHCASRDGTQIPMFIVRKMGLTRSGNNPCVLYGYGGFNISLQPRFIATLFPWLERGGVYAVANLRGGGERGEAWHRAGMLESKQNVFDDFFAAAEYLIKEGYTKPERLACWGGSNGGLLTGVAVTQRPDLFAAAISSVPLLDMLRYHKFLMARFWVPEYGSAEDPEQFHWLLAYSPYHNIKKGQRYPAILLTAGENDNRVHPLHARKMAAALQALANNDLQKDPILLWVDRDAGHGAGKPLSLRIREVTDRWAFLMWQTGMKLDG